ncbi:LamG-like jellyroll fold domain-containing protein [Neorhodopirellula pilleata]|uniref:LamG-like jellyroll fold domain-containing protein n=1 Tax=Neorhodopirellula pilleata TaxID=2714738 RepID=A0A5C6AAM2_9BACT|nr:LamG-like jellyroll fold domain-containing protein [Neorhodopirellula pilleata]TWT96450.1 hypothetical protein Pla100_29300 [Neorhodopirellula pilleata]
MVAGLVAITSNAAARISPPLFANPTISSQRSLRMFRTIVIIGAATLVLSSVSNVRADLITGLTHYWDFDHSAGFTLDDNVGTNSGTLQGFTVPTWVSGKFGNALSFDGINDQVSLGGINAAGNQLSVGGWVRLNRLPSSLPTPFEAIFDSAPDTFVLYSDRDNQELRFKIVDQESDAARPGIAQSQLSTANWVHVLGVYDGTNNQASIYLNGALADQHIGSDFTPGPLTGNVFTGGPSYFGSEGGQWFLSGTIDDFAVWDRVLTVAEISQLQTASVGQLTAVPEPSSLLLIGSAGVAFLSFSRRRKAANNHGLQRRRDCKRFGNGQSFVPAR